MIRIIKRSRIGAHHETKILRDNEFYFTRFSDENGVRWVLGWGDDMTEFPQHGVAIDLEREYQSHILGMTSLGSDPDSSDAYLYGI